MEKLELKHLAGYLPYGLKVEVINLSTRIIKLDIITLSAFTEGWCFKSFKPILRPLSDLITHSEFVDKYHYNFDKKEGFMVKKRNETYTRVAELEYLLKHHFDIYGLIEKGLAIDINTL